MTTTARQLTDGATVTLTGPVLRPDEQTNACGAAWWILTVDDPAYGYVDVHVYPYMAEAARPLMVAGTRVTIVGRVDAFLPAETFVIATSVAVPR
jgi:hypothetical protein